jgi:myo-inositol-1-phosphate synthase
VVAPPPPAPPGRPAEEERKREEARRFARLLVSEIRLYNEQAVQAGKISRDIYQRLKDDIDRSREMYEQRVSADVRGSSNYFHDELVRILADGEADALGM